MFSRIPGAVHGELAAGPELLAELTRPGECWNRDLHQGGHHEPHVQRLPHAGRYVQHRTSSTLKNVSLRPDVQSFHIPSVFSICSAFSYSSLLNPVSHKQCKCMFLRVPIRILLCNLHLQPNVWQLNFRKWPLFGERRHRPVWTPLFGLRMDSTVLGRWVTRNQIQSRPGASYSFLWVSNGGGINSQHASTLNVYISALLIYFFI